MINPLPIIEGTLLYRKELFTVKFYLITSSGEENARKAPQCINLMTVTVFQNDDYKRRKLKELRLNEIELFFCPTSV